MSLVLVEAGRNTKNAMVQTLKPKTAKSIFGGLTFVILSILSANVAVAQTDGKVRINADPRLESEMQKDIAHHDSTDLRGYRIQIYFGNNRSDAEKIERKFKSLFPDNRDEVYLRYYQPYWRVRIGNYYRKIDAQHLLHELTKEFENVLLIKDEIELPKLDVSD